MNELALHGGAMPATNGGAFSSPANFEQAQRMAKLLSMSDLVPKEYKGNLANCVIALNMANRIGVDPLFMMQNLHIIEGRTSLSSQFLIGSINNSGRFSPLRYKYEDKGAIEVDLEFWSGEKGNRTKQFKKVKIEEIICTVVSVCDGKEVFGTPISMSMAVKEGWYGKTGSKWQTMPRQMLAYRAASFFARLYCPELTMGLRTQDEIEDIGYEDATVTVANTVTVAGHTDTVQRRTDAVRKDTVQEKIDALAQDVSILPDRDESGRGQPNVDGNQDEEFEL